MQKKYVFISGFFLVLIVFLIYCFFPVISHNYEANKPERIYITDRNGIVITDKANKYGYRISSGSFFRKEENFIKDLVKIEDKNYYLHFGVNILSKFRALFGNIKAGEITSGGSTITEQYIKNEFFPNSKRTYLQKAREATLAFCFSVFNSKDEILNSYLQNVYFGNNVYGLQTAIEVFFNKTNLDNLNEEERVLLISILHKPSLNLKSKDFENYFKQVQKRLGYDFERTIFSLSKPPSVDKFPFVSGEVL